MCRVPAVHRIHCYPTDSVLAAVLSGLLKKLGILDRYAGGSQLDVLGPLCRQDRSRHLRRCKRYDPHDDQACLRPPVDGRLLRGIHAPTDGGVGWTALRRPSSGNPPCPLRDDATIPLTNAKILNRLLTNARLHVHDDSHVELITNATEQARVIDEFRHQA
jgi:hypothetical protein